MATTKPYSYHSQLLLLTKAISALAEANNFLDQAFNDEVAQLGPQEASEGEYGELARLVDDLKTRADDHAQAVRALAEHEPPLTVQTPSTRMRELLQPIARKAAALGYTEQDFVDAARDAF